MTHTHTSLPPSLARAGARALSLPPLLSLSFSLLFSLSLSLSLSLACSLVILPLTPHRVASISRIDKIVGLCYKRAL